MNIPHPVDLQPLSPLFRPRAARTRRASSWDRTGANRDWVSIGTGETFTLMEHAGPGCITHLYCALALPALTEYRDAILRCYWDGSERPSVEAPLGDFFGVADGRIREVASAMVAVNPGMGISHGLNAYFPMPYSAGARITLEHRGDEPFGGPFNALWYHVEYETYDEPLPEGTLRFHASFRQEAPTTAVGQQTNVTAHDGVNLDGAENYVALDTTGSGRMVGLLLMVDNEQGPVWYGEGDDMVFVDDDTWPPSIHGTGTEEIFGGGACPATEYAGPYTGFHQIESPAYDGLVAMYRWYLHDPIHFSASLRWTIEHGHANNFANRYASVAYWYQSPLAELPPLPERDAMRPRLGEAHDLARAALVDMAMAARAERPRDGGVSFLDVCRVGNRFYAGDWAGTLAGLEEVKARYEHL